MLFVCGFGDSRINGIRGRWDWEDGVGMAAAWGRRRQKRRRSRGRQAGRQLPGSSAPRLEQLAAWGSAVCADI